MSSKYYYVLKALSEAVVQSMAEVNLKLYQYQYLDHIKCSRYHPLEISFNLGVYCFFQFVMAVWMKILLLVHYFNANLRTHFILAWNVAHPALNSIKQNDDALLTILSFNVWPWSIILFTIWYIRLSNILSRVDD